MFGVQIPVPKGAISKVALLDSPLSDDPAFFSGDLLRIEVADPATLRNIAFELLNQAGQLPTS